MKIAVLGPSYPFRGGISHYSTSLFRALAERHDVRYLSFLRQYPKWLFPGKDDREPEDSPFWEPRAERMLDGLNPLTWHRTGREARRWGAEALVMPWWVPYWTLPFLTVMRAAGTRTKKFFICHNVRPHEKGLLDALATRWVLCRADGLIAHSSEEVAALRRMFPRIRTALCFHPIYETFAAPGDREAIRKRLGLDGPTLLFFGFVRPYKRLDLLVRALPLVRKKVPGVRLLVVGEFWKDTRADTNRLIKDLGVEGCVRIVDRYVKSREVADYYLASDLVTLPYDSVTGSGVLQVSFALERPVVATRVGSFNEAIREGVDGLLVPPGNAKALAEGILRALAPDMLARLSEGAKSAKKRFGWNKMVDTIESLAPHA